jgi:protein-S-isoprenylcysteine O-methyltransferase Ste14
MGIARYWIGVLLVVSMPAAILWWFVVHPLIRFWRRMGARRALWAVGTPMLGITVGLIPLRDALLGRDLGTHRSLVALATLLAAAGTAMGLWRRRHLTQRMLSGLNELEGDTTCLLTHGPYAALRHPRYVEVVLFTFAYAAFANHVGAWVVAVVSIPMLHAVVVMEERELAERFGAAWTEYSSQVPRYLPRIRRAPPAVNSSSSSSQSGRYPTRG